MLFFENKKIFAENPDTNQIQKLNFNEGEEKYDDFDVFVSKYILNPQSDKARDNAIARSLLICYLNLEGFRELFEKIIVTQEHTNKGNNLFDVAISIYKNSGNIKYVAEIEKYIFSEKKFLELNYQKSLLSYTTDTLKFKQENKQTSDLKTNICLEQRFTSLSITEDSYLKDLIKETSKSKTYKNSIKEDDKKTEEDEFFSTTKTQIKETKKPPIKETKKPPIIQETLFSLNKKETIKTQKEEDEFFS